MLRPEDAGEALRQARGNDAEARRKAAVARLPREVRGIGVVLLGDVRVPGIPDRETIRAAQQEAHRQVERLGPGRRAPLFRALFPHLADHVERWWTHGARLPYQMGWERKSFRAPNDPLVSLPTRGERLMSLVHAVSPYERDARWLATWAGHLEGYGTGDVVGSFLAAVIEGGGEDGQAVLDVLIATAHGEHEVGVMGRHVPRALLTASRPEGWECIERLLIAAQRQEGLRQTILETVDEAHPEAFRRMLRLIREHNLTRFAATVRALDVWLGYAYEPEDARALNQAIERLSECLDNPAACDAALAGGDAETVYLALWTLAFENAPAAVAPAAHLLRDADTGRRFAAVHFLAQLGLNTSQKALLPAAEDPDLRVAWRALLPFLSQYPYGEEITGPDLFETIERNLPRFPRERRALESIVWPWQVLTVERKALANVLVRHLGQRPATRLIPHLPEMDSYGRHSVVGRLAAAKEWDAETRSTLFALVGDVSASVREEALKAIAKCAATPEEAAALEALLTRKAGDLRRGVLSVLLSQPDPDALTSAGRLAAARSAAQRSGGLELLRRMAEAGRSLPECRRRAADYRDRHPKRTEEETRHLDAILGGGQETPTLDDALGLADPAARTRPDPPVRRDVSFATDAAVACLQALDELVHSHREVPVTLNASNGGREELLGSVQWGFVMPDPSLSLEEDAARLPLREVWEAWWRERPAALRDADGCEILRALAVATETNHRLSGYIKVAPWARRVCETLFPPPKPRGIRYPRQVEAVVTWLIRLHPQPGAPDFLLHAVETTCALIPLKHAFRGSGVAAWTRLTWRHDDSPALAYIHVLRQHRHLCRDEWADPHHVRLWRLDRWMDEPSVPAGLPDAEAADAEEPEAPEEEGAPPSLRGVLAGILHQLGARFDIDPAPGTEGASGGRKAPRSVARFDIDPAPGTEGLGAADPDEDEDEEEDADAEGAPARFRPPLEEALAAFQSGGATEADLFDHLLGPRDIQSWGVSFHDLWRLSGRRPAADLARYAFLPAIVDRCRRRILEVELARGDTPTAASPAALSLRTSGDMETLIPLVQAMGRDTFLRGYTYDSLSRAAVFSHLIRGSFPALSDTPDAFAGRASEARIPHKRLIELGVYAPQWSSHVERALAWPGFSSAVWWIHAHTKDTGWTVDQEIREAWNAEVNEHTPLTGEDLIEGAVDVAWFRRVQDELGPERWAALDDAAKFASGGGGHTRAQLFAGAMTGAVPREQIITRIREKRHQDSVRALGLLPIRREEGDGDILERYRIIQEFVRGNRQFGSQRQESEKRAARIALQNLARTAGYRDPIRLEWAMEARGVADLADGPLTIAAGDVQVALAIDDRGRPDLRVTRAGKPLKSVPAALRKEPGIAALRARVTELRRQSSRIRLSLEAMMCRGDAFTGAELRELLAHPVLAPMLERLVLVGDGIAGYPVERGKLLLDAGGEPYPLPDETTLRIAHPTDLLATGNWHRWQRECFQAERVQPLKQVFRELYVLTAAERADGDLSRRYAGHQVNPRQALALLGTRGWVNHPEEGVRRTFHDEGLTAWIETMGVTLTPADVDGITLEGVRFSRRGEWQPLSLAAVPPRVFSEVMRDVDLVVSVAHRGGVDPEASASTVGMRAALVQETCAALKLGNVRVEGAHAHVEGKLRSYTVHLGSAVVHMQPGGHLCIVPVHEQHRGRLFLPFADDDPRTAEALAKVLLLATDEEIKDPTILEQIRR